MDSDVHWYHSFGQKMYCCTEMILQTRNSSSTFGFIPGFCCESEAEVAGHCIFLVCPTHAAILQHPIRLQIYQRLIRQYYRQRRNSIAVILCFPPPLWDETSQYEICNHRAQIMQQPIACDFSTI